VEVGVEHVADDEEPEEEAEGDEKGDEGGGSGEAAKVSRSSLNIQCTDNNHGETVDKRQA